MGGQTVTKTSPTTYTGTREDVVGQTLVTIDGNVATFSYQVYLSPETQENLVTFFDRIGDANRLHFPAQGRRGEVCSRVFFSCIQICAFAMLMR